MLRFPMRASAPTHWLARPLRTAARCAVVALAGLLLLGAAAPAAWAQRPFAGHDPLYREETARRLFFDSYALSGEVSYRPTSGTTAQEGEGGTPSADPLGLNFRFDYQLARQLDLGAIVSAAGSRTGRSLSVSWVMLKYYEYAEGVDYSFRLAVDPASDGLVGFPQMDAALIFTAPLAPRLYNDVAPGVRRVRMGYDRWVRADAPAAGEVPAEDAADRSGLDVVRTRIMGWELHAMVSYGMHFDPAGSNLFVTFLAEGGNYTLFETDPVEAQEDDAPPPLTTDYQAAVIWMRTGLEFNRPGFRVNPFIGFPITQWSSERDGTVRARLSAGVSLMLR